MATKSKAKAEKAEEADEADTSQYVEAREIKDDYVIPEDEGPRVPGLADLVNEAGGEKGTAEALRTSAGMSEDSPDRSDAEWRTQGQEYHVGPEQPRFVKDDQVADDSGT